MNWRKSNNPDLNNRNFMPIQNALEKVSNWRGWDYYYDLDSIRQKHKQVSIERVKRAVSNRHKYIDKPFYGGGGTISQPRPNINKKTKIPSDVAELFGSPRARYHREDNMKISQYQFGNGDYLVVNLHSCGKNPGDVVVPKHWGVDKSQEYHGIGKKNPKGQSPSDLKRSIVESYKRFPKGKNPGDVLERGGKGGICEVEGDWLNNICEHCGRTMKRHFGLQSGKTVFIPCDEEGANPGDFFSINTKPFPDAHFAVFPPDIVVNPIKSSCPKEVCAKCGMPKIKISKVVSMSENNIPEKRWKKSYRGKAGLPNSPYNRSVSEYYKETLAKKRKKLGYAKCSCNAGFKPGIVFDPFAGSGTTLLVAKQLGYRYLGIEIVEEYVVMAKKRLGINDYYVPNSLDDFVECGKVRKCEVKNRI